jgi:hypothetical protein
LKEEDGTNPEVQAVKQQAQQVIDQLQQQIQAAEQAMAEAEQEAKLLQQKAMDAQSKQEYDLKKLDIDAYNAETNRMKVEMDAAMKIQEQASVEDLEMVKQALAEIIMRIEPPDMNEETQQPAPAGFLLPEGQG